MTTPVTAEITPILWAVLKPTGTGFSFAIVTKTNGTIVNSGTSLKLPIGVNQIQVDWSGASNVRVQAGDAIKQVVDIPAGKSGKRRSVFLRVPVDTETAMVNITTYANASAEVGQALGGIQVFPSNIPL